MSTAAESTPTPPTPAAPCSLAGCGEDVGTGRVDDRIADELLRRRRREQLLHTEELDGDSLEDLLVARGRERRTLLKAASWLGMLSAVGPLFACATRAGPGDVAAAGPPPLAETPGGTDGGGRLHVVESNAESVHLGVFDTTLANLLEIESGDRVSYVNTWSHFMNQLQPGVPVERLAELRVANPGRGPHSIVGPIGVRSAEPGDVLEIRYERVQPFPWAATFNYPGQLGLGALPDLFTDSHVKYFELDLARRTAAFSPGIELSLEPFQGTLGVAPPSGFAAPRPPGAPAGVYSSVPPGPHAGNVDLREQVEGTSLFIPVWQTGAKLYTGDSHALQGDGEVNLTALETRLQELRIRVVLHKQVHNPLPIAETPTHWIILGFDPDLGLAFRSCLVQTIDFLARRAELTRPDAYALCSLGVSFRITQVVDVNKGVHAMIPKRIFSARLRGQISVV